MKKRNDYGMLYIGIILIPVALVIAYICITNAGIELLDTQNDSGDTWELIGKVPDYVEIPDVSGGKFFEDIIKDNGKIQSVSSLEDDIGNNAAWCGTFNLIWNDLRDELAKQDIVFQTPSSIVENLNKGTFSVNDISEDSYYKTYGIPTLELKNQIEKAIKDKFNEKSDILEEFEWGNPQGYFLYAMLKKEFKFPKVFTILGTDTFGNDSKAKYFGIDSSTDDKVRNQVDVLYYNSENDFAVKLKTSQNDEVIFSVGNNENNFLDIYNTILNKNENYIGAKYFQDNDLLKVPYINIDIKQEFKDVEDQPFKFANGREYIISKALQTIKFELNEEGGKIKSEAGMMVMETAMMTENKPRYFYVDQPFTIFLIEEGRELPYFAARISNIENIQ